MSLPPTLQALSIGARDATNTLELYLDYLCPFSAKIFLNFHEHIASMVSGNDARYRGQLRVVIRPVPQPWHASSTWLHETALAVARLARSDEHMLEDPQTNAFWQYSVALMRELERWNEANVRAKSADEVRAELTSLAVSVLGEDARKSGSAPLVRLDSGQTLTEAVRGWTRVGEGNSGSRIVPDLKYCVKIGRQNSIHVTPTALWNGVVEPSVSSSFSREQWVQFLDERMPRANM